MSSQNKGALYEEGGAAYDRGDFLAARRCLRAVVGSSARRENRARAEEILRALDIDRFAIALAAGSLLVLGAIFGWIVLRAHP
jgi:hypothetical protein